MVLTDAERAALPPARCTRTQTGSLPPRNLPASVNQPVAAPRRAAPKKAIPKKAAPAKARSSGKRRKRSEESSQEDEGSQSEEPSQSGSSPSEDPNPPPKKMRRVAAKATASTSTKTKGRGRARNQAADEEAQESAAKSEKRGRNDDDADDDDDGGDADEEGRQAKKRKRSPSLPPPEPSPEPEPLPARELEQTVAPSPVPMLLPAPPRKRPRRREPSPSPAPSPKPESVWDEDAREDDSDTDRSDNGNRDGDEGGEDDEDEDEEDDEEEEEEEEEEIEEQEYSEDEELEEWEMDGDGEFQYSSSEYEDSGHPDSSDSGSDDGEDEEDYYRFFIPRGALYCEFCLSRDSKAYFLYRRNAEMVAENSDFVPTVLAAVDSLMREWTPPERRGPLFDQVLTLSDQERDSLADTLAGQDAHDVTAVIGRRWNAYELGPERRDEGSLRNEATVDRCQFAGTLVASACFRCGLECNTSTSGSRVPEALRPHWNTFRAFANDSRLDNRSLEQLREMDVRRLRRAIHKDFLHPICYEARGMCLAVDPCGDGPMMVFIGVAAQVKLAKVPNWAIEQLARKKLAVEGMVRPSV